MKVIVICERKNPNEDVFKTSLIFDHTSNNFNIAAAGWNGNGAGLSIEDLDKIHKELTETAVNIHKITIELVG